MKKETFESVSARRVGPRHGYRMRFRWSPDERMVVVTVGFLGLVALAALVFGLVVTQ